MIHVHQRLTVPPAFTVAVATPGAAWLAANPAGTKLPPYWRVGAPHLRAAYKGICAYFCCYVYPTTGAGSTDHFVPKSKARAVAYAWSNYRFACSRMNSRKRDASDVLDPFTVPDGWFELYFPTMRVRPGKGLTGPNLKAVRASIKRLKLNSEECRRERAEYWDDYNAGRITGNQLVRRAPMIALEGVRQGVLQPADAGLTAATIRSYLDS